MGSKWWPLAVSTPTKPHTVESALWLVAGNEFPLGVPHGDGALPSAGADVGVGPAPRLVITARAPGAAALLPLGHPSQAAALYWRSGGRAGGRGGAVQACHDSCSESHG